jgi:cytochrome c-type biogenesis protein
MGNLPLPLAAFVAGLISFLSPCVLPLVPGYISLISGATVEELRGNVDARRYRTVLINSLMFIAGFTVVFVMLGATATSVGQLLREYKSKISIVAGVIIILFGLHLTGLLKISALYQDKRMHSVGTGKTPWGSFLVGFAFAFGWTPCIGPILATILTLAASQKSVSTGMILLTLYSLGLAVPFIIASLGIGRFMAFYQRFSRHLHTMEVASGVLLILIGALFVTGRFTIIASHLTFLQKFVL